MNFRQPRRRENSHEGYHGKKPRAKSKPAGEINEASIENLAQLICGVLTDPDCPPEIYDHLIYGINECVRRTEVNHHPGYITAILIEYTKGGEGR